LATDQDDQLSYTKFLKFSASEETYPTSDALLKAYKDEHQTFSKKENKNKSDLAYLKYLEDLVIETKSNLEQ
jgi:hypothetical protein